MDSPEEVDSSLTEMRMTDEYKKLVKADRAFGLEYSGDLTIVPSLEACLTGNAFHYGTDGGQRHQMSGMALKDEADNAESHIAFKLIKTACYGNEGDRWPAVLKMIEAKPANAELVDKERGGIGRTPLHWACAHGAPLHVVRALLEHFKDATLLRDAERKGTTPLPPSLPPRPSCTPLHSVPVALTTLSHTTTLRHTHTCTHTRTHTPDVLAGPRSAVAPRH